MKKLIKEKRIGTGKGNHTETAKENRQKEEKGNGKETPKEYFLEPVKENGTGTVEAFSEETANRKETANSEETANRKETVNNKETVSKDAAMNTDEDGSVDSYDEKNMIMEQNRLLKEKKRKKNRKKRQITGGILLLCAAGGIWYLVWGKKLTQTSEGSAVRVTASPGQEIVYARLDSVNGNEITYTVAKESVQIQTEQTRTEQAWTEKGTEDSSDPPENNGRNNSRTGGREAKDEQKVTGNEVTEVGQSDTSAAPDGHGLEVSAEQDSSAEQKVSHIQDTFYSTEMPDMAGMGEMTGSGDNGDNDGMPAGPEAGGFMGTETRGEMSGMRGSSGAFTYNSTVYQLTEETAQSMIPVGTPVTTRLGTVTTFSRLAAGDYVAFVVEEDSGESVIAAVYIVG